jgi:hypothetical protein
MGKIPIFFIYAEGCNDCDGMQNAITAVTQSLIVPCEIIRMKYTEKKAIEIASDCGIEELPCCIIGEGKNRFAFAGKKYTESSIAQAIEEIWSQK